MTIANCQRSSWVLEMWRISLKSGCVTFPPLFFFLKIALTIQCLLWFYTNFRIVCSISVENAIRILIGVALDLYAVFRSMSILTILIIPIHEYRIFLHLFLISFVDILQFSIYGSFKYLVKFHPEYFILFYEIVNEIVFLISLSDSLLLIYRKQQIFVS